jgi:hypothetical protein
VSVRRAAWMLDEARGEASGAAEAAHAAPPPRASADRHEAGAGQASLAAAFGEPRRLPHYPRPPAPTG